MKRYKLIKEYPGSTKLGSIGVLTSKNGQTYVLVDGYLMLHPSLVLEQKEFWQEIVEKEYEILAFYSDIHHGRRRIDELQSNNKYKSGFGNTYFGIESYLGNTAINKNGWKIYSIKRLSDGEVFTIGDKFTNQFSRQSVIKKFIIIYNSIDIQYENGGTWSITLRDTEKAKEPLFKTEDGVDIFPGDRYYFVNSYFVANLDGAHKDSKSAKQSSGALADFSTKEAAEEYILMHKPCLSLYDIRKLDPNKYAWEEMRKLVKSKL